MTLHLPQMVVLFLIALNVVLAASMHGKAKLPYNGPLSLIDAVTTLALLYWGGFFG